MERKRCERDLWRIGCDAQKIHSSNFHKRKKKMEMENPKMTKTASGKFKALDRAHLAKVMQITMNKLRNDQSKLNLFSTCCSYIGYSVNPTNLESTSQMFMKHATKSLNQSIIANYKSLNQLDINPISSTTGKVKETKAKRGRRVSYIGKTTARYSSSDINRVKDLLTEKKDKSSSTSEK